MSEHMQCDHCETEVENYGNLYSLIIDLPNMQDAGLGEYCEECAQRLADGEYSLFIGGQVS